MNILQTVSLQWSAEVRRDDGLVSQGFRLSFAGREVPGVRWTKHGQHGARPLLLMGHGGSSHKTGPEVVDRAAAFVLGHDYAVVAIDGPLHGERRPVLQTGAERQAEFLAMWTRDPRIDDMVSDWRAVLDHFACDPQIDPSAIGWYGVSMGTAYGLPLIACEPRIKAALLGMWGTSFANGERLAVDAVQVRCPVLFQQKWDDALFTRAGQIDLFTRLGTEQKWLCVYPGPHAVTREQFDDGRRFIVRQLAAAST